MEQTRPGVPAWLVAATAVLLSLMAHRLTAAELDSAAPSSAPVMGELRIEGDAIEEVTLTRADMDAGNQFTVPRPYSSVSIPAGAYRIWEVRLKGGYCCSEQGRGKLISVRPDEPCVLKLGAPLKPVVTGCRDGQFLGFNLYLLDTEGRYYGYARDDRPPIPRFVISSNGRPVGSGSCGYG